MPARARKCLPAREILDSGAERIDAELTDSPVVRGRLLATLGRVYHGLGLYDRSEEFITKAVDVQREHLGPDDPELARTLDIHGILLHDQGDTTRIVDAGPGRIRGEPIRKRNGFSVGVQRAERLLNRRSINAFLRIHMGLRKHVYGNNSTNLSISSVVL